MFTKQTEPQEMPLISFKLNNYPMSGTFPPPMGKTGL